MIGHGQEFGACAMSSGGASLRDEKKALRRIMKAKLLHIATKEVLEQCARVINYHTYAISADLDQRKELQLRF